jgi:glucose-1-phosphate thymidylyltransferase
MIYHPIKKLVGAEITDIMVIAGPEHVGQFMSLLGSGKSLDCDLTYRVQEEPKGIAHALALTEDFSKGDRIVVLLGDNIFQEPLFDLINYADKESKDAQVVLHWNDYPERFGVADVSEDGEIVDIIEKPVEPKSSWIVTGIYAYPPDVYSHIKKLKPSRRGELEISDVNYEYMKAGLLKHMYINNYWTDAGIPATYKLANEYVSTFKPEF